jgi:hypothetical protein
VQERRNHPVLAELVVTREVERSNSHVELLRGVTVAARAACPAAEDRPDQVEAAFGVVIQIGEQGRDDEIAAVGALPLEEQRRQPVVAAIRRDPLRPGPDHRRAAILIAHVPEQRKQDVVGSFGATPVVIQTEQRRAIGSRRILQAGLDALEPEGRKASFEVIALGVRLLIVDTVEAATQHVGIGERRFI